MNRMLWPMALGFKWGVALRAAAYRRGWLMTRRLSKPVVSVGNLTVGGTGKTPLVKSIAERLRAHGWKPDILTRGYARQRGAEIVLLAPSVKRAPDPREVGDEPAFLARSLPEVPIAIGADRFRAGRLAEERFNVDVHILDDGFQHLALARDLDVVALDVTQELSDRALLPAGRLREPVSALARALLVVITRVELEDSQPLEDRVRSVNPQAGIFHARTALCGVVEVASGTAYSWQEPGARPVAAFCGIGNPQGFFADLRHWGFRVVEESAFPDHRVYTSTDLRRLAERARKVGAAALVTTEKDVMNFPSTWEAETPVLACAIRMEIVESEAFETVILSALESVS
ncbi:MAG: tetraacyldisaccharide 4'-kinase [Acidobacteria bacterium]|nr:tetraacyldisaccharide 4'-kinase [Acidobacteriota bacterium]